MKITTLILSALLATNLYAQIDTAATASRQVMTRAELLRQSASALTALQQSNADQVRAAVESARLARQQFELNQTTREALVAALRRAAVAHRQVVVAVRAGERAAARHLDSAVERQTGRDHLPVHEL